MDSRPFDNISQFEKDKSLVAIPFFRALKRNDPWQFDLLLRYAHLMVYNSGETVLSRWDIDSRLYFLLKGQLGVYIPTNSEFKQVNYVSAGEVFGSIAMLMGGPRMATVQVDKGCKQAKVLSIDFNIFGELEDTRVVHLATKLSVYRNIAHSLRWKLEIYRSRSPDGRLANEHRKIKLYTGPKDTKEELVALNRQCRALASILVKWNREISLSGSNAGKSVDYRILSAIQ